MRLYTAALTRMRPVRILFPALMVFLSGNIIAGTVHYQMSGLGSNLYRYDFVLGGMQLEQNQQLEIRFDPAIYQSLAGGAAGSDFSVKLLQPNNPPGTFGDYIALALVPNPSLAGPFSVDVEVVSTGQPGSVSFVVNQLDQGGTYLSTLESGVTSAAAAVPEPVSSVLIGSGLLAVGALLIRRGK